MTSRLSMHSRPPRRSWPACALAALLAAVVGMRVGPAVVAQAAHTEMKGWPQISPGVPMGLVSWVDVDGSGTMFVLRRCPLKCADGQHPGPNDPPGAMLMFDRAGKYTGEWEPRSGGKWKEAHGLHIDRNGDIWTTDVQLHIVRKYRRDGTLLMTLGRSGVAGETAETFNKPTDAFVASDGSIFVTDGYGNQRVVKFDANGTFVKAWGKRGTGPGEFRLPHAVTQDRSGRILVADRCGLSDTGCRDGRLQVFDTDGRYLTEWTPPGRAFVPLAVTIDTKGNIYVDDAQNQKVWILSPKDLSIVGTVEGASGHAMGMSADGNDIYVTGGPAGVRRFSTAHR